MENKSTTTCGLFGWRPKWIQRFARKEIYVLLYSLIGAVQGMSNTYLSSVLTTIEKQFGIKSQEAAWIFSGNEISQICFIFVLPFLSRIHKRIMWTSLALMVSAVGIFLCSMPYLIKDKSQYLGGWKTQSVSTRDMCRSLSDTEPFDEECHTEKIRDWGGMALIFIGFFISGIGTSFFYSFGVPYIDDNVSRKNSPMAISVVLAGRTLGPALGYVLGTATLKVYVVPGQEGAPTEGESGWLGAWWLGFIIVSSATLIVAPLLGLFPERLPTDEDTDAKKIEKQRLESEQPQTAMDYIHETLDCAKRLLKNKVYVFNSLSTIFFLFGFIGFGTFVPKYFEYHFRRSASSSGSSGGMSKAAGSVAGILISGFVLSKFKFRSRIVSGWNVFIGFAGIAFFIAMSLVACPKLEIVGGSGAELARGPGANVTTCYDACQCSQSKFRPTCSSDGVTTFFSPCHAGCSQVNEESVQVGGKTVTRKVYSSCSCIQESGQTSPWWKNETQELKSPLDIPSQEARLGDALEGYCPFDCSRQFMIIIGMLTCYALLGSTGRVGNQLLSLRAVEPRDKSAGIIIMVSLLSLFVFLPSPIIFANIMDNACIEWGNNCGEVTNCLLYDTDMMRTTLCYVVAACLALTTLADIGVWWYSSTIKLWDEAEEEDSDLEMKLKSDSN